MARSLRIVLLLLVAIAAGVVLSTLHLESPTAPAPTPDPETWHTLRTGRLARALVERRLYELAGHEHFFVRVRVENLQGEPVGVDLRDYWAVMRPNQWGGLRQPQRGEIDERRMRPDADALRGDGGRALRAAFRASEIHRIPPRGHLYCYVEFNASGRTDVERMHDPFLFVSMDGELRLTTGTVSEQITLEQPMDDDDLDSDVILEAPFRWGRVPPDAVVLLSP